MKLRQLIIKNFRGIKYLKWDICSNFITLIGPGDSTKTTILDAISFVLSPYWNLNVSDFDFYESNLDSPIEIFATLVDIPENLLSDEKFGLCLRGWSPEKGVVDEPFETCERALTIHFCTDSSLEPEWHVFTERDTDIRRISSRDREKLGMNYVQIHSHRDFAWGRNSALSRISSEVDEIPAILADVNRQARKAVADLSDGQLQKTAEKAESLSAGYGVRPKKGFKPGLDDFYTGFGSGSLSLHDGEIPVRYMGEGSKRLLSIALQSEGLTKGGIILIDEIEVGLEPYRLRELIHLLRTDQKNDNQYLMTTHSAFCLLELDVSEIFVTRNENGTTFVKGVPNELQNVVRSLPEALLARRIVVCEGKTELGFSMALVDHWKETTKKNPAYEGVIFVDGRGSNAIDYCKKLNELGFDVCYWADSDVQSTGDDAILGLEKLGIKCILWADKVSIEERIFLDIPLQNVSHVLNLAIQFYYQDEAKAVESIASSLQISFNRIQDFEGYIFSLSDEEKINIRNRLGQLSTRKKKEWFKNVEKGRQLGELLIPLFSSIEESDLVRKIEQLKAWCYD